MSAQKRDYYEVLGITQTADQDNIKRAYRQAAMKFHPDRNRDDPDAETKFKEAAEAYEVLSDAAKRQRYDQYGHAGLMGSVGHDFVHMDVGDIFSMFEDIFTGGQRRRTPRGMDLQTPVEIALSDVAAGCERTIEFQRNEYCDQCAGSGAAPGTKKKICTTCGGYGQVEQPSGVAEIFGRMITSCPTCRGEGQLIVTPCNNCRGSGRYPQERVVRVKIPPGIHDGQAIRVRGEGEPGGNGAPRGDLHCVVSVRPHPFLVRQDNDLICKMPISFTQAALGAKVQIPTLEGKAELTIPRGTQPGQVFRLRGMGLVDLRTERVGDELVQVLIEIPKKLDAKQKNLLRQFAETEDAQVLPESKGFFSRVVEYFAGQEDDRD